jgi:alkylhydroperoxidase family enzyme
LLNHCRYTTSHRARAARASGSTADDFGALAAGDLSRFTDDERAALDYATQLTLQPPALPYGAARQAVDGDVLRRLKASFTDPQIVELTAAICLWNALTRFHRVMGFELDMDPPPAVLDEVL